MTIAEAGLRYSSPRLRYHNSISDAVADLGDPEKIGHLFSTFQKFLYQPSA